MPAVRTLVALPNSKALAGSSAAKVQVELSLIKVEAGVLMSMLEPKGAGSHSRHRDCHGHGEGILVDGITHSCCSKQCDRSCGGHIGGCIRGFKDEKMNPSRR